MLTTSCQTNSPCNNFQYMSLFQVTYNCEQLALYSVCSSRELPFLSSVLMSEQGIVQAHFPEGALPHLGLVQNRSHSMSVTAGGKAELWPSGAP